MPLDDTNFSQTEVIITPNDYVSTARRREDEIALQVLRHAVNLIERGWTKKAYARFLFLPVPYDSVFCTRYCMEGGINRAGHDLDLPVNRAKDMLAGSPILAGKTIVNWNDARTKKDAIFAMRCAIVENTPV